MVSAWERMAVTPLATIMRGRPLGPLGDVGDGERRPVGVHGDDGAGQVAGGVGDPFGQEGLVEVGVRLRRRGQQQVAVEVDGTAGSGRIEVLADADDRARLLVDLDVGRRVVGQPDPAERERAVLHRVGGVTSAQRGQVRERAALDGLAQAGEHLLDHEVHLLVDVLAASGRGSRRRSRRARRSSRSRQKPRASTASSIEPTIWIFCSHRVLDAWAGSRTAPCDPSGSR